MANKLKLNRYLITLGVCTTINLIICFWVLLNQGSLPPQVPLFYGLPQGEEQLASAQFLLIPPLIAIVIGIINFLVTRAIKIDFLKMVLLFATILVTMLSSITVTKIIWIL